MKIPKTYIEIFRKIGGANPAEIMIGVTCAIILFILKVSGITEQEHSCPSGLGPHEPISVVFIK